MPASTNPVGITYCINNGKIVGPTNVGGILGMLSQLKTEVKLNSNYGSVEANAVGGAKGSIYGDCEIDIFTLIKSNADVSGKTDKTNVALTVTPVYPNYAQIDADHEKWIEDNTKEEEDEPTDEPSDKPDNKDENTDTQATPETNNVADTEQAPEEKKGCGSTVGAFAAAALITAVAGVAMISKKKD